MFSLALQKSCRYYLEPKFRSKIAKYTICQGGISGKSVSYDFQPGRVAWLQMARGSAKLNDYDLNAGDGVSIDHESSIAIKSLAADTEVLLFDMAA